MAKNKFRPKPYTEGPWNLCPPNSIMGSVITAQPDKTKNTFNIGTVHGGETIEEARGNAIIAARSPEMYEAIGNYLKALSPHIASYTSDKEMDAIKKMEELYNQVTYALKDRQIQS